MQKKHDDEGYTALLLFAAAGNGKTEEVKELLRTRQEYLDKQTVEVAYGMAKDMGFAETATAISDYMKRSAARKKRTPSRGLRPR